MPKWKLSIGCSMTVLLDLAGRRQLVDINPLATIPEEEILLGSQKSTRTRRAYPLDVPPM